MDGRLRRVRGIWPRKFRSAIGEIFWKHFPEDLAVLRYERDQQGNGKFLLGRWDEDWMY